jgi:hypothetical protein
MSRNLLIQGVQSTDSSTFNFVDISGGLSVGGSVNLTGRTIIGDFAISPDLNISLQVEGILAAQQLSGDGSLLTGVRGVGQGNFTVSNTIFTTMTGITTGAGNRLYTNPSDTISLIRRIDIMNSNDSLVNTQMYYVPSTGGEVDVTGVADKFLDIDMPAKASLRILVPNGIVLSRQNDTIQAVIEAFGISGSLNIKMIGETGTQSAIAMRDIVTITGISNVPSGYIINQSKTNIYNMLFHNTTANVETVKVYDVRNVAGSIGAANSGNQILELTLSGADTLILGEEYNMILNRLESINDSLQFSTSTSGAVNLMVFGETGNNV